ncbi:class I SAM-dependent methyltransferase [Micromonospora tulbaghiae]|uniref:Class I SAM-dependent methyltransferase n=1 Tax=Micromonospora tulbaghiae TaxID=479978 RepID=A0AAW4JKS1_9ACTN|nr:MULTISPECIES: class I SAM-dependent methyltransferase [Micromonospora]MBO4142583.1 class I SAM-dependent methyltransferase [Micromonospora tulbaghiae]MDX5459572.1 class I SAM-dependent methyltransferase [Micromonospora tulbaghiae]
MDAAGVEAGSRVLDVGTGPGTVAALACGRDALVTAVDAEPSMVDLARRRLAEAGAVHQGALPDLPFPDRCFDAAVANFVMNHVGHPAAALRELRRVVRPGSRIAVTIWPYPLPPLQQLWGQIFDAAGGRRPVVMHKVDPARDFPRTAEGLTTLLADVGLGGVQCDTITWVHRTDPEDWWSGPANGIGALGMLMESQPPEMIVRIRETYDKLTAAYRGDDGLLALPTAALLASAVVA